MNNPKYIIKKEYGNYPIGTEVFVKEDNDTHILVFIDGTLEYMNKMVFWIITDQV